MRWRIDKNLHLGDLSLMNDPYFFGYGSLVNLSTHEYQDPKAASLSGWRRIWLNNYMRDAAFLSVHPAEGAEIDGIIARVPDADWIALDARETGYDRLDATDQLLVDLEPTVDCAVYVVPRTRVTDTGKKSPILLSYLDVVLQGFMQIYGSDGLDHFFATTDSWDRPVHNDRHKPIYPRHRHLDAKELTCVNAFLKDHNIEIT